MYLSEYLSLSLSLWVLQFLHSMAQIKLTTHIEVGSDQQSVYVDSNLILLEFP
jgi:hypothetical protein